MGQNNLRPLIRKLQQALALQQGRRISMSIFQSYSPKAQRTVSKYILSEQRIDDDGKARYHTLIQSWSLPEIVKCLAAELNAPDQHGGGDATT